MVCEIVQVLVVFGFWRGLEENWRHENKKILISMERHGGGDERRRRGRDGRSTA